ncbi:MAG TPA: hypothetical protein VHD76_22830 [Bryobacteraceae bacterium]|jgi:hypothetical protein|nr:hypothetical protein [Bryobacteraceae bacterium]
MDLIEARQQRREILAYVKRQQAEDASCVSQIKSVTMEAKRELLQALAGWLAAIDTTTKISDRIREAFAKVTDRVSIDVWVELKQKQRSLKVKFEDTKVNEQKARSAYHRAAPFGFFSSVFADAASKRVIQDLESAYELAMADRATAERDFERNERALYVAWESFLRDSQISEHLTAICGDPELRTFAAPILEEMSRRSTELWRSHARKHAERCLDLELAARGLRLFYENSLSSEAKYLLGEGAEI